MRYPSLSPSFDAGARVVFEALAATVAVGSRSDRRAVFPRYAGYYAWLSRLPRRLRRSCNGGGRSLAAIALLLALGQAPAFAVPPNADAGPDQNAVVLTLVALSGSGSDPDGPNPLIFQWTFVSIPAGSALTNSGIADATTATASFIPDVPGDYLLRLDVFDGEETAFDEVVVTVGPVPTNDPPNVPPTAAAGPDQNAVVLTLVTLNGSGSNDPDNGPNPLTFQWTFVSTPAGSALTNSGIADATTATASFIPDVPGDYLLRLDVFDGVDTAFDEVVVTAPPQPPSTPTTPPTPPPPPDLSLSLTDIPDPLTVKGQLTYTITVMNIGPGIATGVQVVDDLPSEALQPGPPDSSQGECRGTVRVDCDLGTLAPGALATVTINVIPTVIADLSNPLSNRATVFAVEPDLDDTNNSFTATTTVRPPPDLATADLTITAEAAVGPMASDQGFTYTLTVRNDGPATATGVQLTNDLPTGIALDPLTASPSNCSSTDPMLCTLGTLTSGAEATVKIDVIRSEVDTDTLPNRAAVNLDQHDPNPDNNFALTSALDLPTRKTTCDSKRCRLRVICNVSDLLERRCDNQVITLFVDTRARRLSDGRAARPPRVRFAATVTNIPGDQTKKLRLKITSKGKNLARTLTGQGKNKLRAMMEIRNHVGGIGKDVIPITVRLK